MLEQVHTDAGLSTLRKVVSHGIQEADPEAVSPRDWKTIGLAVHDVDKAVVGGVYGATMWSWLMIDGLWVAPEQRGRGLGRRLLLACEEMAIGRGCVGSRLGTFDFQARGFYERHGYFVFGALEEFPSGHTHFQLRKNF